LRLPLFSLKVKKSREERQNIMMIHAKTVMFFFAKRLQTIFRISKKRVSKNF